MQRAAHHVLALIGLAISAACFAQAGYPDKPVRILVGYSAGGSADVSARLLAQRLGELWGKPVIVDNVTGSSGIVSADRVAKAPPDGYTLLAAIGGQIVVNQHLYSKLPYDPVRDLAPAGTPEAVIRKIHADTVKALAAPDLRARYAEAYLEVVGNSPEEMAKVIREEIPRWAKLIKDSGARAD